MDFNSCLGPNEGEEWNFNPWFSNHKNDKKMNSLGLEPTTGDSNPEEVKQLLGLKPHSFDEKHKVGKDNPDFLRQPRIFKALI